MAEPAELNRRGSRSAGEPHAVKSTATSTVFSALRSDILSGALLPGQRLKIEALRERYNATVNPMREALNRLVAEGFVDIEDQRGFSVAAISLDHWRELVRTRCLVESCALSEAIAQRSEAWEDEIVVSLHRLARTPRFLSDTLRTPNPDWEIVHQRFHKALLAACGSSILLGFCQDLREQSDRYRHIASVAPEARLTYRQEHEAIAKAALDGDADLATKTLRAHYERTLIVVEKFFNEPA